MEQNKGQTTPSSTGGQVMDVKPPAPTVPDLTEGDMTITDGEIAPVSAVTQPPAVPPPATAPTITPAPAPAPEPEPNPTHQETAAQMPETPATKQEKPKEKPKPKKRKKGPMLIIIGALIIFFTLSALTVKVYQSQQAEPKQTQNKLPTPSGQAPVTPTAATAADIDKTVESISKLIEGLDDDKDFSDEALE